MEKKVVKAAAKVIDAAETHERWVWCDRCERRVLGYHICAPKEPEMWMPTYQEPKARARKGKGKEA